jgi:pantetheine-phosphate adenylyltransferase
MKIGIYAGCFDPPHNGHLWVMNQCKSQYDQFHVVIGTNLAKEKTFIEQTRVSMLKDCGFDAKVLGEQNIVEYATPLMEEHTVTLVRGIRNYDDFDYEKAIQDNILNVCPEMNFQYVIPPNKYCEISSTDVRTKWLNNGWESVKDLVPEEVVPYLKNFWVGFHMFEDTTAGFAPASISTGRLNKSASCRTIKPAFKKNGVTFFGKMKTHYERMVDNGLIIYPRALDANQVREMLDPFPFDMVESEIFHLKWIPINSVGPTGERYLPCSQSLGPIIVDLNVKLTDSRYGNFEKYIIIEGKHRWLDAKERGDTRILAWVGEKVF